jgi:hypothetical protein
MSHCAKRFVCPHGVLTVRVTAVCTFGIGGLLTVSIGYECTYFTCPMTDETGQRVDYEIATNVEMLIEHIREEVGWELSCKC